MFPLGIMLLSIVHLLDLAVDFGILAAKPSPDRFSYDFMLPGFDLHEL